MVRCSDRITPDAEPRAAAHQAPGKPGCSSGATTLRIPGNPAEAAHAAQQRRSAARVAVVHAFGGGWGWHPRDSGQTARPGYRRVGDVHLNAVHRRTQKRSSRPQAGEIQATDAEVSTRWGEMVGVGRGRLTSAMPRLERRCSRNDRLRWWLTHGQNSGTVGGRCGCIKRFELTVRPAGLAGGFRPGIGNRHRAVGAGTKWTQPHLLGR